MFESYLVAIFMHDKKKFSPHASFISEVNFMPKLNHFPGGNRIKSKKDSPKKMHLDATTMASMQKLHTCTQIEYSISSSISAFTRFFH